MHKSLTPFKQCIKVLETTQRSLIVKILHSFWDLKDNPSFLNVAMTKLWTQIKSFGKTFTVRDSNQT